MDKIDFVLPWVDGGDPEWRKEKARFSPSSAQDDSEARYRDWDCLRYWFRGVEKFAPWVRKVHLITWGHLPPWLNVDAPQLNIVRHSDYIPAEYLPTFSSRCIELNLHRISDLSERFVYMNDDTFLLKPLKPEFFFRKGLPVDCAALNPISTKDLVRGGKRIFYAPYVNTQYLNRDFDMRRCITAHPLKWYNFRYGRHLIFNLMLSFWPRFVGFWDFHLPQPYLKSSFAEAWQQDEDILHSTCTHAFRSDFDVNQWFIRYRRLAQGAFEPGRPIRNAVFHLGQQTQVICDSIRAQKLPMICVSDTADVDRFEWEKEQLQRAFEQILPNTSQFEKGD